MRYNKRKRFTNGSDFYKRYFEDRHGVDFAEQYSTPVITYPSKTEFRSLKTIKHIWRFGDRLYKLADEHYGDPEYWWVISWFNKTPTEFHIEPGKVLLIPHPLNTAIRLSGV